MFLHMRLLVYVGVAVVAFGNKAKCANLNTAIIDCDRCRLLKIVWKTNCLSALTCH